MKWFKRISKLISLVFFFIFLLFPLKDLRDLITLQIYEKSGRTVFVLFNQLHFSFLPPSIFIEELELSSPQLPSTLKSGSLKLTPFSQLFISQVPAGKIELQDVFSGSLEGQIEKGPVKEGVKTLSLELSGNTLNLSQLGAWLRLPLSMSGQAQFKINGFFDPTFAAMQPDLDLNLLLSHLNLPAGKVETQMGPLQLPEFTLNEVKGDLRWSAGRLYFTKVTLGQAKDQISGQISGSLGLNITSTAPGQFVPVMSDYQIDLDLTVKSKLATQLSLLLIVLDPYKTTTTDGYRYQVRLQGQNTYTPPNILAPPKK